MSCLTFVSIFLLNISMMLILRRNFSIVKMNWLFLFYWVINITIGIFFFNTSVSWKFDGLIVMLFYVDIYVVAYTLVISTHKTSYNFDLSYWENRSHIIQTGLLSCFVTGLVYMVLELVNNGFSLSNLLSVKGFMETGYYFTDGRYGGSTEIRVTTLEQVCLTINYSGFILAGYSYRLKLCKKRYCFLQFIPMVLSMMATTAKTTFISGIFLWICGYLVAMNCYDCRNDKKQKVPVLKLILIVVAAVALFYASFLIRYGIGSSQNIFYRILMYAFGHVPCYDDWFSKFKTNLFGYSHGQQTFMLFFGSTKPIELTRVYVTPRLVTRYGWTNVITIFSYVLMDYGYIGSIIFWCIFGMVSAWSVVSLKRNGSAIAHGITGLSYYIILYSFLVSPMRYLSIVGAFLLFGIYIFVLLKLRVGPKKC